MENRTARFNWFLFMFPQRAGCKILVTMTYIVWPTAVVVIAVVFMLVFKKPLERLVDRTKKIGTTGLDASVTPSAASQETRIQRAPSAAEELLARFENDLLREQECAIRRELDSRKVDDASERERVLIRHLAASYIYSRFDRTYRLIFGSQITTLQDLNTAGISNREIVRGNYHIAAMIAPEFYANYTFEQWLHFLISQGLVQADGENLSITLAGREFLKFLIQEGLSFNRPG